MAVVAPQRGANPFDSSGVRRDENGIRRYADLHDSIVAMPSQELTMTKASA